MGDALLQRAQELGVSIDGDQPINTVNGTIYAQAPEKEIQRRVIEAERHLRERRLFIFTTAAACASVLAAAAAVGSMFAVVRNGSQQTENARRLLSVQLAQHFDERFDSAPMRRKRQGLAISLLNHADPPTDDVIDMFETMAYYVRQGTIDREAIYNDFGYTITHYWPAVKTYVETTRVGPDSDPFYYEHFEWLNGALLQDAARRRHQSILQVTPSTEDVGNFLRDEADLLQPPKPRAPGKQRKSTKIR